MRNLKTLICLMVMCGSLLFSHTTLGGVHDTIIVPTVSLLLNGPTDFCPDDPIKLEPGICGCSVSDADSNWDGIADCLLKPGATDIHQFLVVSDGSHSLGDTSLAFNSSRDQGSKIVYFDSTVGNNTTADVYWWDGTNIVDSTGSTTNPGNGQIYGTDPLEPNESAIQPFLHMITSGDSRLRTQMSGAGPNGWRFSGLAGGYPDWFLFRRGQTHTDFDMRFAGGRSEKEPMVAAAYGPLADGRAIMAPPVGGSSPFSGHNWGYEQSWFHQVLYSFEIRAGYGYLGTHVADTYAEGGGPVTAFIEDCYWPGLNSGIIVYPPHKTTFRRSIVTNSYRDDAHNQGYYTSGFRNTVTFDEVIFYKNGYKTNPITDPDPKRTIFDRNFYQGGGAKMGHTYRNVISADGGSGGPQMRLGGLMENSLVIEGYFYSSTDSNSPVNDWMETEGQVGSSAVVRNNVQLIFGYPSDNDPDTYGVSDSRAHPFWGYSLSGGSFGALVEKNIITGAMTRDDLSDGSRLGNYGLNLSVSPDIYSNGKLYSQRNNRMRENIVYAVSKGLNVSGEAQDAKNITIENNVFAATSGLSLSATNLDSSYQVLIDNNRFYANDTLPSDNSMGDGNALAPYGDAQNAEGWSDPDRTLKRYVTEVLGLTLLDWTDNPLLDTAERQIRIDAGETYDPAGIKTFMAIATNMRYGGTDIIPSNGKPNMLADYPWDERFTAKAVVNWIRAGFNMAPVQ